MRHLSLLYLLKASSSVENQLEITWRSLMVKCVYFGCLSQLHHILGILFTLFWCIFALLHHGFPDDLAVFLRALYSSVTI